MVNDSFAETKIPIVFIIQMTELIADTCFMHVQMHKYVSTCLCMWVGIEGLCLYKFYVTLEIIIFAVLVTVIHIMIMHWLRW